MTYLFVSILANLTEMRWSFIVTFIGISLMTSDMELFIVNLLFFPIMAYFKYYTGHLYVFCGNFLFKSSART